MARLSKFKFIFSILFIIFTGTYSFGEIIVHEDYGFSLDIPEGYNLTDGTSDGKSFMFNHPNIPVTFVIKVYDNEGYKDSEDALSSALTKLSAQYDLSNFNWNNYNCSISNFQMILDKNYTGWSISSELEKDVFLVLLCYGPTKDIHKCEEFILSTLNSLSLDDSTYNTPGIITSYAFPKEGPIEVKANIGNKEIISSIDKSDSQGSQFVVDMEFTVLTYYANHKLMEKAWKRYYRMIYRDSYSRLENFSNDVYKTLYPLAEKTRPDNPEIQYAQYLLSWVQNFKYARAQSRTSSDFTNLPAILLGHGNDCDSRSMLVSTILEHGGIDCLLLISPEFSHGLVAAKIEGAQGQTFTNPENGKDYIMGETTANVTWGMISQAQADRNKWFSISLAPEY